MYDLYYIEIQCCEIWTKAVCTIAFFPHTVLFRKIVLTASQKTMNDVVKEHMPKKKTKKGGMSSWFSWRRTTDTAHPAAESSPGEVDIAVAKSVSG